MPVINLASTEALPGTVTYTNHSGSNATLTIAAGIPVFIDGVEISPYALPGVLIKNESTLSHNGVYGINQYDGGVSDTILIRIDTAFTQPYAIAKGINNVGTIWIETNVVNTIGTDSIVFIRAG